MIELFQEPRLAGSIALRGGTSLNKLFIQPASRYSEDIDLVQTEAGPIGPTLDGIRDKLDSWLGEPARARAEGCTTLTYRFESEIAPVRPLRLRIEINTREHFTVLGFHHRSFNVANPWFAGVADVRSYELDELLGTKLRALYQRRKGRDLFDLWLCISRGLIDAERIVRCFEAYMKHGGHRVSRAEFEQNLHFKRDAPGFMSDIRPLLRHGIEFDAASAIALVCDTLIQRLPGEAWRGVGPTGR